MQNLLNTPIYINIRFINHSLFFSFFFFCPRPPACISLCIYLPFDLLYHSQMAGVNRIEVHCWHVIYVCRMWCKWVCVWVCVCGLCGACCVCGCKRVSLGVCDVMQAAACVGMGASVALCIQIRSINYYRMYAITIAILSSGYLNAFNMSTKCTFICCKYLITISPSSKLLLCCIGYEVAQVAQHCGFFLSPINCQLLSLSSVPSAISFSHSFSSYLLLLSCL